MMTSLEPLQSLNILPLPPSAKVERALAGFVSAIDGKNEEIAADRAPNADQRSWLERRAAELEAALRPCDQRELGAELSALFAVSAMAKGDDRDASVLASIYKIDLAEYPYFAVREACLWWRRNEKWAPKIPELRAKAEAARKPFAAELQRIRRVLVARIAAPASDDVGDRAAFIARMRPVMEKISGRDQLMNAVRPRETHDEALARLAREYVANPVALTPEALNGRLA